MSKCIDMSKRPIGIQVMIKEMIAYLGYSQRFFDSKSNNVIEGMYYGRMPRSKVVPSKSKYSQKDVFAAILADEMKVRERAGL